jgi:hypothetical protein
MAFPSAQIDEVQGFSSFRVSGNMCHKMGPLIPEEGVAPKFAQLYILDPEMQVDIIHGLFKSELDRGILKDLRCIVASSISLLMPSSPGPESVLVSGCPN